MLFAYLKRILGLDRLRLRGPSGAKDEFLLAATAQNLGNWRSSSPFRRRSSPHEAKSQESASRIAPQIPSAGARTRGSSTKSTWSSHCPAQRRTSQFRYIGGSKAYDSFERNRGSMGESGIC